jgi:hypothetical protein
LKQTQFTHQTEQSSGTKNFSAQTSQEKGELSFGKKILIALELERGIPVRE